MQVLLTRRTDALRHHAGQVSFPGGRIEDADADPVAAALREASEEVGLAPAQAQPLGYLDPLATITGFRVLPVVARIDPDFVAVPDPARSLGSVRGAAGLADGGRQPARMSPWIIVAAPRHVLEFRRAPAAPTQRIWGATASILFNLRERLERSP